MSKYVASIYGAETPLATSNLLHTGRLSTGQTIDVAIQFSTPVLSFGDRNGTEQTSVQRNVLLSNESISYMLPGKVCGDMIP